MNTSSYHNGIQNSSVLNYNGSIVLIYISMLYMSIMLCNAILTNRYIGTNSLFVLGGTFTSPFIFIIDDIIAEIYGYKITRNLIFSGFAAQTIFVLICQLALNSPYPSFFKEQNSYSFILGFSLLRIDLSGFFAYIIANLLNSYILSHWKFLVKGRYFWLRSIGASTFSEAIYSFIAIIMIELKTIPIQNMFKLIFMSYLIKVIYSFIFAFPAQYLVAYLKNFTGIDVYDIPKNFTPLHSFKLEN